MEEEPGICNGNYVMIKSDKPKEHKQHVQRSPIKTADSALSRALHKQPFSPPQEPQQPLPAQQTALADTTSPSVSPPSLPQSYLEPASHATAATSVSSSVERKARFKHHKKPTVSDSPRLVELCEEYIANKNIDALAKIARQRGLPPHLRQKAWPMLLAEHPYVLEPNVGLPEPRRRPNGSSSKSSSSSEQCKSETEIPIRRLKGDLSRLQRKLKSQKMNKLELQYKQLQSNPSSHVSTTLSARSTPLSISPVSAASEGSLTMDHLNQVVVSESHDAQRFDIYEDAIESFLTKYHVKYESGLVWVAAAVAECVDPLECDNWIQVYENFLLVLLHTPQRDIGINEIEDRFSGKNYYSDGVTSEPFCEETAAARTEDPAINGAAAAAQAATSEAEGDRPKTAPTSTSPSTPSSQKIASHVLTDSISLFLSGFRRGLPELSAHFDEEDVLASIGGGDEWLIWWIKWMGAKTWNSSDRARVWDMYLGWKRVSDSQCQKNIAEEAAAAAANGVSAPASPTSDASESDIGMDPFWSPMKLDRVQEPNLPPRIQHLFICLAMIKAKKNTLLELEQSEIREYLSRLGKSKDIEGIVLEAGEIWRSWQWSELESEE
ncbi:Oxidant-induced cell-cycle arrest protein 5 [Yarrowia sp. C11]|nr:Oxidant-induced cell-cycle arrest protein 5 [Yarrowia sp. E02]KAG5373535.1 Oxidant-induced cell-cycle arrest protein 5 [Yarrowia sp. C11]